MGVLKLMFHDDWEIYGDGSGDISELMFEPASQILEVCDKYSVKYTFFAEFGQQLAMKKSGDNGDQSSAEQWEAFLKNALQRGHDVQLHFHPQWIDAKKHNGKWQLDFGKWSIGNLSYEEAEHWLSTGKNYLENLLKPIQSDFRIVAFRAGSWMAQPSKNLIKALKSIDILADCTVIKGKMMDLGYLGAIDFSDAPSSLLPWYCSDFDIATENEVPSGLICIPTYSELTYLHPVFFEVLYNYRSLIFGLKRNIHFYRKYKAYNTRFSLPNKKTHEPDFKTHYNFLHKLFKSHTYYLDFGKYHYKTIIKSILSVLEICKKYKLNNVPLILCSHSKSFYSIDNFHKLLKTLANMSEISFQRTQKVVENIDSSLVLKKQQYINN